MAEAVLVECQAGITACRETLGPSGHRAAVPHVTDSAVDHQGWGKDAL